MLQYLFSAGAAAATSVYAGYASMAPLSQLFGATYARGSKMDQLALTYDDGPNDPHTLRLLDVLERHNARATFFLIGKFVEQRPDIARAIAQAGHTIGNHTHSHPFLILRRRESVAREIERCRRAIEDAVGAHSNLFRPPFGGRRPGVLAEVRKQGMRTVMWSVTCYEWKGTSPDSIERHAARQVRGGDILLLHDGGHAAIGADRNPTVQATDRLLRRYRERGFEFVTVPEMMAADAAEEPAVVDEEVEVAAGD